MADGLLPEAFFFTRLMGVKADVRSKEVMILKQANTRRIGFPKNVKDSASNTPKGPSPDEK